MNLRKLAGLVLIVLGTVLTGIMIMMITGAYNSAAENSKTAIIGGADCPTAIFLISRGEYQLCLVLLIGVAMLIAGIIIMLKKKNKK